MLFEVECASEACDWMGVSGFRLYLKEAVFIMVYHSTPAALQYEKFHIPDAIRVLDAVVSTLSY